jgi:hypothetical protein
VEQNKLANKENWELDRPGNRGKLFVRAVDIIKAQKKQLQKNAFQYSKTQELGGV